MEPARMPCIIMGLIFSISDCKDLLKQLLKSNPDERVKMDCIMKHPWMNEGHALPFGPARFPNKLDVLDLNADILYHMVHVLKVC